MDKIHPVVQLLAQRMESHPEEFTFNDKGSLAVTGRWGAWIAQLGWHFNEEEKELIYGRAKELIFGRVHKEVMDELLNGDERRAEAQAKVEPAKLNAQQQYSAVQQQIAMLKQQQIQPVLPGSYYELDTGLTQTAPTSLYGKALNLLGIK